MRSFHTNIYLRKKCRFWGEKSHYLILQKFYEGYLMEIWLKSSIFLSSQKCQLFAQNYPTMIQEHVCTHFELFWVTKGVVLSINVVAQNTSNLHWLEDSACFLQMPARKKKLDTICQSLRNTCNKKRLVLM